MLPRTKPSRRPKFQTSPPPSAPRPTIGSLPLRPALRPVKTPPARSPPPPMILSEANAWACLRYPCAAQRRMAGRKDPAIPSVPGWKPVKRRRQAPNRLDFPSTTRAEPLPPPIGPKITPTRTVNQPTPFLTRLPGNSRFVGNPGSRPPMQTRGPNTRPPPSRGPSSKPQPQPGGTPP